MSRLLEIDRCQCQCHQSSCPDIVAESHLFHRRPVRFLSRHERRLGHALYIEELLEEQKVKEMEEHARLFPKRTRRRTSREKKAAEEAHAVKAREHADKRILRHRRYGALNHMPLGPGTIIGLRPTLLPEMEKIEGLTWEVVERALKDSMNSLDDVKAIEEAHTDPAMFMAKRFVPYHKEERDLLVYEEMKVGNPTECIRLLEQAVLDLRTSTKCA